MKALDSWNERIGVSIEDLAAWQQKHPVMSLEEVDKLPDINMVIEEEDFMASWGKSTLEECSITVDMKDEPTPVQVIPEPLREHVKLAPEVSKTAALERWQAKQERKNSLKWSLMICAILVAIGFCLLSFMVRDADAGITLMRFEVFSVTEETIVVVDEHDHFFTFYRDGSNVSLKKGDEVTVLTDLVYAGTDTWEWDRSRTAIISNK